MAKTKTVASVSFHSNHSVSMDVEEVLGITMGAPMKLDDGQWFCELIIRSANGTLALQMLADYPERFAFTQPDIMPEEH